MFLPNPATMTENKLDEAASDHTLYRPILCGTALVGGATLCLFINLPLGLAVLAVDGAGYVASHVRESELDAYREGRGPGGGKRARSKRPPARRWPTSRIGVLAA
jgi:hypothetical protein